MTQEGTTLLRGAILPVLEDETNPVRFSNTGGSDIAKTSLHIPQRKNIFPEGNLNLDAAGESRTFKSQIDLLGINLACS